MKYAKTYKSESSYGLALDQDTHELPITIRRVTTPQRDGRLYTVDRFSEGTDSRFRVCEVDLFGARNALRLLELQWFGRLFDAENYIEERVRENLKLRMRVQS